jgi:hypothetical protein
MDQIFKNSLILKEFQLELIQDLDQLLLLVRFKSPCNMNMQDSLSFQLIKAYWKSKILLFQIKQYRKLWDLNPFLSSTLKFLKFKMSSKEKWLKKSFALCANSSLTPLLNAKSATSFSANTANLNWTKQAAESLLEDILTMNLLQKVH